MDEVSVASLRDTFGLSKSVPASPGQPRHRTFPLSRESIKSYEGAGQEQKPREGNEVKEISIPNDKVEAKPKESAAQNQKPKEGNEVKEIPIPNDKVEAKPKENAAQNQQPKEAINLSQSIEIEKAKDTAAQTQKPGSDLRDSYAQEKGKETPKLRKSETSLEEPRSKEVKIVIEASPIESRKGSFIQSESPSDLWKIDYSEFELEELVSEGSAGNLYLGYWYSVPVAIKSLIFFFE